MMLISMLEALEVLSLAKRRARSIFLVHCWYRRGLLYGFRQSLAWQETQVCYI
jgi:hypothetical protein